MRRRAVAAADVRELLLVDHGAIDGALLARKRLTAAEVEELLNRGAAS